MIGTKTARRAARTKITLALAGGVLLVTLRARARETPAPAPTTPAPAETSPDAGPPAPPPATTPPATVPDAAAPAGAASEAPKLTVGGYVEAYYAYNLGNPANSITNYRWVDNRHNTFELSTVVLDLVGELRSFNAHIAFHAGPTADGWYADSVEARAGASGAAGRAASTWKYIQQANVGYKAPIGRGLLLSAGLFLTPIGYEGPAVKDNFNWSRSNLFFTLPFYHVGARATYELTDRLTAMLMVTNGWNQATDSNDGKSMIGQLTYKIPGVLSTSLLYMGGPERPQASAEGRPWRHLFDAWLELDLADRFAFAVHGDAGFEEGNFGVQSWRAGALYARVQPLDFLYVAARGDYFYENVPSRNGVSASSLFYGSDVGSITGTIDLRPMDHVSFRVEYRHDAATAPLYFKKGAEPDATGSLVSNARTQDTITLGLTGWL